MNESSALRSTGWREHRQERAIRLSVRHAGADDELDRKRMPKAPEAERSQRVDAQREIGRESNRPPEAGAMGPLEWVARVLQCDSYASAALALTTELATRFKARQVVDLARKWKVTRATIYNLITRVRKELAPQLASEITIGMKNRCRQFQFMINTGFVFGRTGNFDNFHVVR